MEINIEYQIREIRQEEYAILDDFLYEVIFIPQGVEVPPKSIIKRPELQVYVSDFGRKDDCCLVAEVDGKIIGACWTRIMDDYGHIDDATPSFAISLYKEFRRQGIGTALMEEMLAMLRRNIRFLIKRRESDDTAGGKETFGKSFADYKRHYFRDIYPLLRRGRGSFFSPAS